MPVLLPELNKVSGGEIIFSSAPPTADKPSDATRKQKDILKIKMFIRYRQGCQKSVTVGLLKKSVLCCETFDKSTKTAVVFLAYGFSTAPTCPISL